MEITQKSTINTAKICRLCAMEHLNGSELFTSDSQKMDRLAKTICSYLGIECSDDGLLPNWLCLACQLEAETTEKFLALVQDGQQKLQHLLSVARTPAIGEISQNVSIGDEKVDELAVCEQKSTKPKQKGKLKACVTNKRTNFKSVITTKRRNAKVQKAAAKEVRRKSETKCRPKRLRRPPKRYDDGDAPDVDEDTQMSSNDRLSPSLTTSANELTSCALITTEPIAELRTAAGASLAEIVEVDPMTRPAHSYHSKIRLICEYCKEVFAKHRELLSHLQTHNNCAFECTECLHSFRIKSEFEQHQKDTQHQGMGVIENMASNANTEIGAVRLGESVVGKVAKTTPAINIVVDNNGEITCIDSRLKTPPAEKPQLEAAEVPSAVEQLETRPHVGETQLMEPIKSNDMDTKFACLKCDKLFETHYAVLRHHKQVHVGERTYKCQQCSASFKNQTNFAYHLAKHTGQRQYKCEICGKAFILKHELTLHMRTHTGDKPYKCGHCPKAFAHRSNLVVHQRLHTGQRPFRCETCGASFNSSSHCKTHKAKHLKQTVRQITQQQLVSKRCIKGDSAQQKYLKMAVNLKAKRGGASVVSTVEHAYAENSAPTSRSLLKPNVHKGTTKGAASHSDDLLITNVKILPSIQITTAATAETPQENNRPKLASTPAPTSAVAVSAAHKYQCVFCAKLFKVKSTLTKHVRTHTGEKPYRCPHCPRTFSDPSNLKKHKKLHKSATEQLQSVSAKMSNANLVQHLRQKQYAERKSYAAIALASPVHSIGAASDPDPDGLEAIERVDTISVVDEMACDQSYFSGGARGKVNDPLAVSLPVLRPEGLVCISYQNPENPNDKTTTTYFVPN